MEVTLTELRRDLFRLADRVLETGEPVTLKRKGRTLVLRAVEKSIDEMTPHERWASYLANCREQPEPSGPSIEEITFSARRARARELDEKMRDKKPGEV